MKKILYIIPGWKETCNLKRYRLLKEAAQKKGYEVACININWKKPLSIQVFAVQKEAIIFGFSLGAILAWLVAQNYPCRYLILASMTPRHSFTDSKIKKALIKLVGKKFVSDVIDNLKPSHKAKKQTILYGDKEEEKADILVPDTEHEINERYIKEILRLF